jgi:hypothetical protein
MEHIWSRAVATAGKRWQMGQALKRLKQAKTVAVGCHRLPEKFHGKDGVDGSSPSEGSAKAPHVGAFSLSARCSCCGVTRCGKRYGTKGTCGPRARGGAGGNRSS